MFHAICGFVSGLLKGYYFIKLRNAVDFLMNLNEYLVHLGLSVLFKLLCFWAVKK